MSHYEAAGWSGADLVGFLVLGGLGVAGLAALALAQSWPDGERAALLAAWRWVRRVAGSVIFWGVVLAVVVAVFVLGVLAGPT